MASGQGAIGGPYIIGEWVGAGDDESSMAIEYVPAEHLRRRFSATQQLTVSTSLVSVDEAVGRATVGVAVTEVTGSPPVTRRWAGTWQVVRTPAGWLLDQPHLAPG